MVLMLAEVMRLPEVAQAFPQSLLWRLIAFNTQHVEWQGCSLHDLIQPAFSFLVSGATAVSERATSAATRARDRISRGTITGVGAARRR